MIRTTETLDRESVPHYWLSVYATDLGSEPRTSWTQVYLEVLDINDNAPELSKPMYFASVPENVDKVKSVVQVLAKDVDTSSEGKLSFQMLESHQMYFDVDPKTGNYEGVGRNVVKHSNLPVKPLPVTDFSSPVLFYSTAVRSCNYRWP